MPNLTMTLHRYPSRRYKFYRIVRFAIRHFINAVKAYNKFPSTIASETKANRMASGRATISMNKQTLMNRNGADNNNNINNNPSSHGVSNNESNARSIFSAARLFFFYMISTIYVFIRNYFFFWNNMSSYEARAECDVSIFVRHFSGSVIRAQHNISHFTVFTLLLTRSRRSNGAISGFRVDWIRNAELMNYVPIRRATESFDKRIKCSGSLSSIS